MKLVFLFVGRKSLSWVGASLYDGRGSGARCSRVQRIHRCSCWVCDGHGGDMPYTAVWRTHIRIESGCGVDVSSVSVAKRSCIMHFMRGSYFLSLSLFNLSKYSVMRKSGALVGASTPASAERR